MCGFENFYVDCSSSMQYLTDEQTVEIMNRYGIEKVLYGTASPMWSPAKEIAHFMALPLTDDQRLAILSGNAKGLLKI